MTQTSPTWRSRFLASLLFPAREVDEAALVRRVRGRTIVITGASFGIGEALALRLAPLGVQLVLVARTAAKLEQVRQAVVERGSSALVLAADLRDRDQLAGVLQKLESLSVDILVSNAGLSIRRSLFASQQRLHDFERTMAINYHAPVALVLGLLPQLAARRGQVVQISAVNVRLAPMPGWAAYQASKTAFDQWFRCARPELLASGIGASSLVLPLVKTRMIAPTKAYDHLPALEVEAVANQICHCLVTGADYQPWWLWPCELVSVALRPLWERLALSWVRRQRARGA